MASIGRRSFIETLLGALSAGALVNSPINKVVNRDNVLHRLEANQISYEPDVVRNFDFAGVRGDVVVIYGRGGRTSKQERSWIWE